MRKHAQTALDLLSALLALLLAAITAARDTGGDTTPNPLMATLSAAAPYPVKLTGNGGVAPGASLTTITGPFDNGDEIPNWNTKVVGMYDRGVVREDKNPEGMSISHTFLDFIPDHSLKSAPSDAADWSIGSNYRLHSGLIFVPVEVRNTGEWPIDVELGGRVDFGVAGEFDSVTFVARSLGPCERIRGLAIGASRVIIREGGNVSKNHWAFWYAPPA